MSVPDAQQLTRKDTLRGDFFYTHFKMAEAYQHCDIAQWPHTRESLCTTTTLTNNFAANAEHFIVCLSKVLAKVTLTPTLTLTNHR